jgi:phage terminase large subunit-like protein
LSHFTDISKIDTDKYWYDEEAAESVIRYIENECYHSKGDLAGQNLVLEEWQKDRILRPLFGWKHKQKKVIKNKAGEIVKEFYPRKFRRLRVEVPKKNGKSSLIAALVQIFMHIEPELGAELVGLAWGRKQARIVFDMVAKSIKTNKELNEQITHYRSSNVLLRNDGEKRYSVWSKEAGGEDGQAPNLVIIDEEHEHKNGDLIEVAEKSMATRSNPLSVTITTAGEDLQGISYQRREHAILVTQGHREDESLLVCIYCADKDRIDEGLDDWASEEVFAECNPNYLVPGAITREFWLDEITKAKSSGFNKAKFFRYHLNIWNNTSSQWINADVWAKSQWEFDVETLKGRLCYGGLDLSSKNDVTAYSLVFPIGDDNYVSLNWFFLPEEKSIDGIDPKQLIQYQTWIDNGLIIETPGNTIDRKYIVDKIMQTVKTYDIQTILYDPTMSTDVVVPLQENNVHVTEFQQRTKDMTFGTSMLFELTLAQRFNHLGNPVLSWMNDCCSLHQFNNLMRPIKKKPETPNTKIDGIVSNVMALSYAADPTKKKEHDSYLSESGGKLVMI